MTTTFTPRERQVLQGLWNGLSQKEIAAQLGLCETTVRSLTACARARAGHVSTIATIRIALEGGAFTA